MPWISRFRNLLRHSRLRQEIDEEIQQHIEEKTHDLIREGVPPDQARVLARRRFGGSLRTREQVLDARLPVFLDSVFQDAKFSVRLMSRAPLFTTAVVLALALAIGANTAAFSLLDAVVLRPLPVQDPESLVYLTYPSDRPNAPATGIDYFNYPLFGQLRQAGRPAVDLFAMAYHATREVTFAGDFDRPERLYAQWISGDALPLLGVGTALGRTLTAADDQIPGAHPVAVISYSLWQRRFAGDPAILGRRVGIRGPEQHSYEIVGVLEEGFTGVEPGIVTDIWVPNMMWSARALGDTRSNWFRIWGRLRPGVTPEAAAAALQPTFTEFRRAATTIRADEPAERVRRYLGAQLSARPAANGPSLLRKTYERPLWILTGVVGLLLLVACTTVGNLLLARAASREREMALRVSIGAGPARLLQLILVESALLSGVACVLGCAIALVTAPMVVRTLGTQLYPVGIPITVDPRVLGALAAFGAVATVLFGAAPAVRVLTADPRRYMPVHARTSRLLSGLQVCCCFVVLVMAGLFLTSFRRLAGHDVGFRDEGLFLMSLDAKGLQSDASGLAAWTNLRRTVSDLPGVAAASAAGFGLFSGQGWTQNIRVPGQAADAVQVHYMWVAPEYLRTMGISLHAGRELAENDARSEGISRVVVNQAFAARYFARTNALGRRFDKVDNNGGTETMEIVGVAADTKYDSVRHAAAPLVYLPFRGGDSGTLLIRAKGEPSAVLSLVRQELARVNPAFHERATYSQQVLVADSYAEDRTLALISSILAAIAMIIAGLGMYAVLSYAISRRTKEFGIRVALGAGRSTVIRLVLQEAAIVSAVGVAAGLVLAANMTSYVAPLLFETDPAAALTIAGPILVLAFVNVLFAAPATVRALRIAPADALRREA